MKILKIGLPKSTNRKMLVQDFYTCGKFSVLTVSIHEKDVNAATRKTVKTRRVAVLAGFLFNGGRQKGISKKCLASPDPCSMDSLLN